MVADLIVEVLALRPGGDRMLIPDAGYWMLDTHSGNFLYPNEYFSCKYPVSSIQYLLPISMPV
jgi:hypothetical protein